jgi:ABC-type thiamine transport system substrate-binding protein
VSLDKGPALSPRLQAMLEKKRLMLPGTAQSRLEKTLSKAQEARKAAPPPSKEAKPSSESRKTEKP